MNSITGYRQADVLKILPMLTKADLQNWVGRGTLRLDNPLAKPRVFSVRDLIALAAMWELRRQHIPPSAAAKIAAHAKTRSRSWHDGCRPCVFLIWWRGERLKCVTEYADQVGKRLATNFHGAPAAVVTFHVDDVIEAVHMKREESCQVAA